MPRKTNEVFAIISPHAGYVYSGEVAASAFNQIDTDQEFDHVFVVASSHRQYFDGASIYNIGDYLTPLGRVTVDTAVANELIAADPVFRFSPAYHDQEHSLEVQLPFLQYLLGDKIKLVPIIIGTDGPETCLKISRALKPYLTDRNLFVVSSDFSHYPDYIDALRIDQKTALAITSNQTEVLLKSLQESERSGTRNLATSLCGYTSVLTMLYMTQDVPGVKITQVQYKNSGDSEYGEKNRVVGYQAIAFSGHLPTAEAGQFSLTAKEKEQLLSIARSTLQEYLNTGELSQNDGIGLSKALMSETGCFVTLKKGDRLRGCIGRFTSDQPLYQLVRQMAVASATQDSRFSPVTYSELSTLHIEISVLTPLKRIQSIDEIIMGKHGIYIKKGFRTGTFLPQVATETGWSKEEFLGHCAEDKAGIGWEGWKDAEIYTYEALVFGE